MRIAILFDNFGPYHVARLAGAARKMEVLAVELRGQSTVYDWDSPDLPATLNHVTLLPAGNNKNASWSELAKYLDEQVAPFKPDVVAVPGWSSLAAIGMANWAAGRNIPAIIMSESNVMDFRRWTSVEFLKNRLLKQFSAALCGSDLQKDYLVELGFDPASVFLGYNAVDNDYFLTRADKVRASDKMPEMGEGLFLDAKWKGRYFLTSARFIEKKNLLRLLDAYAAYRKSCENKEDAWPLVILGDGDLRAQLEAKCKEHNLQDSVYLPGWRQYDELPQFYGTAGAFILASTVEPWGTVTGEAMASGLPVLISNKVGCVPIYVENGVNGFVFDPYNEQEITDSLRRISTVDDQAAMADASLRIISNWGPNRFGDGLFDAARKAVSLGPTASSLPATMMARFLAEIQTRR